MIPGLESEPATSARIDAAFAGWSEHFRRRLSARGLRGLLDEFGELVRSVETQTCTHGSTTKAGSDWVFCCGISYEYQNDLAVRDAIEIISEICGAAALAPIAPELEGLDDRLYVLYSHQPHRTPYWWQDGLPAGVAP